MAARCLVPLRDLLFGSSSISPEPPGTPLLGFVHEIRRIEKSGIPNAKTPSHKQKSVKYPYLGADNTRNSPPVEVLREFSSDSELALRGLVLE